MDSMGLVGNTDKKPITSLAQSMNSQASPVMLSVLGVDIALAGRPVLQDVSFTLGQGQLVGLIGQNGAGKTTLLRALLGLIPIRCGTIEITGQDKKHRLTNVGYVPQRASIDPDVPLRARDIVSLGIDGHRLGIALPSRQRRARVDDLLDSVGAGHLGNSRVGHLSGGELQRVLVAHALGRGPKLLLMDEPLANLDIGSVQGIVALLNRLAKEQGVTVFVSAHDMNPLLGAMESVVYLARGKATSGAVANVITSEVLTKLYGYQVDVLHAGGRLLIAAGPPPPSAEQSLTKEPDGDVCRT